MTNRNNITNKAVNKSDGVIKKEDIGRNIKKLRIALGFTQAQVAKKAKMSVSHFGQMERGKIYSTILTLHAISKALCTKIYKLFMKR
ncbi:MAG TPA: helix-turn-helix transcriptional regulator [Elusimicrobiales bacterium]|nr:helix-turn-helix transcriptional regulator [Elusimicrobiales bacterium]